MIQVINPDNIKDRPAISYEGFDYFDFWKNRPYENASDQMAIAKLIFLIKGPHEHFIDIGAGCARMLPYYENAWKEITLLDDSQQQVNICRQAVAPSKKANFIVGTIEAMPFADQTFDTALCVRTFQYVTNPTKTLKEVNRVLKTGGYLILEIPNKIHFKNRMSALLGKNKSQIISLDPINIITKGDALFLNHHPESIKKALKENDFEIVKILSVSNFRSDMFKKIFPISFLTKLEKATQKALAPLWFGPSIYFLARKQK